MYWKLFGFFKDHELLDYVVSLTNGRKRTYCPIHYRKLVMSYSSQENNLYHVNCLTKARPCNKLVCCFCSEKLICKDKQVLFSTFVLRFDIKMCTNLLGHK